MNEIITAYLIGMIGGLAMGAIAGLFIFSDVFELPTKKKGKHKQSFFEHYDLYKITYVLNLLFWIILFVTILFSKFILEFKLLSLIIIFIAIELNVKWLEDNEKK